MSGCGDDGGTSSGTSKLEFMNWVSAEEPTDKTIVKVLDQFKQENDVDVDAVAVPFDEMRQQLLTSISGGNAPDAILMNGSWAFEIGPAGGLLDLHEYAEDGYLDENFFAPAVEAGEYEGALYALPISVVSHGFWRNKKLMNEAGLDPEVPPTTMADLDDQMAELKRALPDDVFAFAVDVTKADVALNHFWIWLRTFGAKPDRKSVV